MLLSQNQLVMAPSSGLRYPITRLPTVQGPITATIPPPPVRGTPSLPTTPTDGVGNQNTTQVTGTQTGTVSDGASGGVAMSGLDDLFGSLGSMFNNLLHPGTSSTTGATTATTTTDNSWMLWVVVALVVYFLFIR